MKSTSKQRIIPALLVAFTLGLAPFTPEPHLVGKVRWLMGGAEGMQLIDYFDLILHGAPWLYLIVLTVQVFKKSAA